MFIAMEYTKAETRIARGGSCWKCVSIIFPLFQLRDSYPEINAVGS